VNFQIRLTELTQLLSASTAWCAGLITVTDDHDFLDPTPTGRNHE